MHFIIPTRLCWSGKPRFYRRRDCGLAAVCLFLFAGVLAQAQSGLTFATWNVRNFLVGNRFEEGRFRFNYPMPETRKARLRTIILQEAPDVLFLQEFGDSAFLKELQLDLKAGGLDYPYAVFSASPGARTGLALLSKFPPRETVFHDPVPCIGYKGFIQRGIQEVAFQGANQSVRFFHVHLKSRYSDDPDDPSSARIRRAEILALADFLEARLDAGPSTPMAVIGDFNTPFDSSLLDPLRPLWHPLPAADQTGSPNTYFHRSGSTEILDGCWIPHPANSSFLHGRIVPLPAHSPSDHRLVSFFLKIDLPSPSYWQCIANNEDKRRNDRTNECERHPWPEPGNWPKPAGGI